MRADALIARARVSRVRALLFGNAARRHAALSQADCAGDKERTVLFLFFSRARYHVIDSMASVNAGSYHERGSPALTSHHERRRVDFTFIPFFIRVAQRYF